MLERCKSFIAAVLLTESLWRLKWHLKLFEILPSPLPPPPPHPSSELEQNGGPQLSRFPQGLWSLILEFRRVCWLIVFLTPINVRLLSSILLYKFRCYFSLPWVFHIKGKGSLHTDMLLSPQKCAFYTFPSWSFSQQFENSLFVFYGFMYRLKMKSQKLSCSWS